MLKKILRLFRKNNYVHIVDSDFKFVKKNIIAEQDGQLVTRLNNRDNTFFQTSTHTFCIT